MRHRLIALIAVAVATLARGEEVTFESALARARAASPAVRAAEAEIVAAQSELTAASRLIAENPTFEAIAGPRKTPTGEITKDYVLTLDQPLEVAGRRAARIELARATLDVAIARRDGIVRDALTDVANAYIHAAAASARARVDQQEEALAHEIEHIAQRRFDLGDVAIIDVNATRAEAIQARAETVVAESVRDAALARLRSLLGYPADRPIAVRTDLLSIIRHPPPDATVTTPEVRQAVAELRRARAEIAVARARARPDFGLAAEQAREENSRVLMGGARITLPLFNRSRPEIRAAQERAHGAEAQLELAERQAEANRRASMVEFDGRNAAAKLLEDTALPLLIDNERLTARSYEVGEIDLAELLTLRRQTNTIRLSAIARVQEAAQAWIDFIRATGDASFVSGLE